MKYTSNSPDDYISQIPEDRAVVISKRRGIILDNIPKGFSE
jgi:hypothetical protein